MSSFVTLLKFKNVIIDPFEKCHHIEKCHHLKNVIIWTLLKLKNVIIDPFAQNEKCHHPAEKCHHMVKNVIIWWKMSSSRARPFSLSRTPIGKFLLASRRDFPISLNSQDDLSQFVGISIRLVELIELDYQHFLDFVKNVNSLRYRSKKATFYNRKILKTEKANISENQHYFALVRSLRSFTCYNVSFSGRTLTEFTFLTKSMKCRRSISMSSTSRAGPWRSEYYIFSVSIHNSPTFRNACSRTREWISTQSVIVREIKLDELYKSSWPLMTTAYIFSER